MSSVWRQLLAVQDDDRVQQFMNVRHFLWILGNGKRILFWQDIWYLDEPLCVVYPCLYRLAVNGIPFVFEYLERSPVGWSDFFCRPLRDFENSLLEEMCACVSRFRLQQGVEDMLVWKHDRVGNLSV
ncbi:hypothetical protein V6N13_130650 [Hibiscus sabdariffa]